MRPAGLDALNQFPQMASRIIPYGARHAAMPHPAAMHAVQAPAMGGIHSLAPRFGPKFQPAAIGPTGPIGPKPKFM